MKHFITAAGAAIVTALILPAAAQSLSKDIAARIEAIPIQTLTISDEQFLKGDAYGKPTTIAGVLRVAQGSGRLPLVIFIAGSSGFGPVSDVWDRQFGEMGISTFEMDSFAGRVSQCSRRIHALILHGSPSWGGRVAGEQHSIPA
jgi:hypothetical protein